MKGIINQISESNIYTMMDTSSLKNIVKKVFDNNVKKFNDNSKKSITLFTGINGYYGFDFTMKYGDSIHYFKHVFANFKYRNDGMLILSLFEKSSLYKVICTKAKHLKLFKGTELIIETEDVNELNKFIDIHYKDWSTEKENRKPLKYKRYL